MIKTHFVFAVSFVALLAVSSAWANAPATGESVGTAHKVYETQLPTDAKGIAGVSYVNKAVNVAGASAQAAEAHAAAAGASALSAADSAAAAAASAKSANEALVTKENVSNKTSTIDEESTATQYPTAAAVYDFVDTVRKEISDGNATALAGKQATLGTSNVTTDGEGNVVTAVTAANGKVTVTKGTTLGSLATKSTVTSSDITDKTIVNADISDSAAIAISKISGLQAALDGKQATLTIDSALSSTSTNPVQNKVVNTALSGKQATISDLSTIRSGAAAGATAVQPGDLGALATKSTITTSDITNGTIKNEDIATDAAIAISKISGLQTALDGKQATLTIDTALSSTSTNPVQNKVVNTALSGKQATLGTSNVTTSGEGNVVTAVTAADGKVTVTKGTTLGSLATKSTVTSSDITDKTIVNADISDSAAIAISKISGLQAALDGKQATLTIDTALSSSSTNPVQNKVVDGALKTKEDVSNKTSTIDANSTTAQYTSAKGVYDYVEGVRVEISEGNATALAGKQNSLTATGAADRPVYATNGGVAAVTGISIPVGTSTASGSTTWAKIWVE